MNKNISRLQKDAADVSEQLMDITKTVDKYIVPNIGGGNIDNLALQCRVQMEKCMELQKNAADILCRLKDAGGVTNTERQSISMSIAQLEQCLVLLYQKEELLFGILDTVRAASSGIKAAEKIDRTSEFVRFQAALDREKKRGS